MGHKVHPVGFRVGVIKGWQSRWYAEKNYKDLLAEDLKLRNLIRKRLQNAGISKIEIERAASNQVSITIHTAKPGIVIGKSGQSVEVLRQVLEKETGKRARLNIVEVRQPEIDAYLVARSVAEQLEKRIAFRRAMKQAVQKAMRLGAKGARVVVSGRLGGAEIARTEKEMEGKIPLHTLRADIDYSQTGALTTYGVIGIKVWIYRGEILPGSIKAGGFESQSAEVMATDTTGTQEGRSRRDRQGRGGGTGRPSRGGAPRQQGGPRPPKAKTAEVAGSEPTPSAVTETAVESAAPAETTETSAE